jgi:hypothetical protein
MPWNASSCTGVKIWPRVANSSAWAWVQQDSVSTSVPSQSNATARGIHPSNGQGLVIWGTMSFLVGGTDGMLKQGRERDVAARWSRWTHPGVRRAAAIPRQHHR